MLHLQTDEALTIYLSTYLPIIAQSAIPETVSLLSLIVSVSPIRAEYAEIQGPTRAETVA